MAHKKSPFVYPKQKDNNYALYHSLCIDAIYGDEKLKEYWENYPKIEDKKIEKLLIEKSFLIEDNKTKNDIINEFRSKENFEPNVFGLYLLLTDKCNLACKYCYFQQSLNKGHKFISMSKDTAKKTIDLWEKMSDGSTDEKIVVLYGGEPLLNFEVLKYAVEYIQSKPFKSRITLVTNGTMINDEIAEFLAKKSISVGLSIDGKKDVHDSQRVKSIGGGSFDEAIAGYTILKKHGISPAVSCTIGKHNMNDFEKNLQYFNEELDCNKVGFNLMMDLPYLKEHQIDSKDYADGMIKGFEYSRKNNIFDDRMMRRIRAVLHKKIHDKDCLAVGYQIVVDPMGRIGTCPGLVEKFELTINSSKEEIIEFLRPWAKRSTLNIEACVDCPAIGICGGGCPLVPLYSGDGLMGVSSNTCLLMNSILDWVIFDAIKEH